VGKQSRRKNEIRRKRAPAIQQDFNVRLKMTDDERKKADEKEQRLKETVKIAKRGRHQTVTYPMWAATGGQRTTNLRHADDPVQS
jgi:hypothetical protein